MKFSATMLCVVAFASAPKAAAAQPTPADFIAPEAEVYFFVDSADGIQFWGDESNGWRVALCPLEGDWSYVESGGRGETIGLAFSAFTSHQDGQRLSDIKSLRVTIKVAAEGRRDYVTTETDDSFGYRGNKYGSLCGLAIQLPLHELQRHWGRLPMKISISATLSTEGLPAASTSTMPISLVPIARDKTSWSQRVESLRIGQTRKEIEVLLGRPQSEKSYPAVGGVPPLRVLTYPNPDAPIELEPRYRKTEILLDTQERFFASRNTMLRC